ncbi:molecular chaperone DnaJ [Flavobacterium sp. RSSA_27]|uniref:molecular chaperone DnaJ n=1 Tax=Flavobacterium sp. RSSA_27 TaxID=3447667 RepID=UPI003F3D28AB
MNDTLIKDSIKVAGQAISKTAETGEQTNWWMWLAIAEIGIIAFFILKEQLKLKDTEKQRFKNESLKQDIDFGNIINSSFNSIQLYDELKVKCHPDRFPTDKEKNTIAENIFQEISKNKNNVKRLLELKEEAKQKLNINF